MAGVDALLKQADQMVRVGEDPTPVFHRFLAQKGERERERETAEASELASPQTDVSPLPLFAAFPPLSYLSTRDEAVALRA